jgi:hypothetical protein
MVIDHLEDRSADQRILLKLNLEVYVINYNMN